MLNLLRSRVWNLKIALLWAIILCVFAAPFASWVVAQTGPLRPPTGLVAAPGNGSATLSWRSGAGAQMYGVFQSLSPSPSSFTGKAVLVTQRTSVTVSKLWNGRRIYFAVRSIRGKDLSAMSGIISVLPQPPPPPVRVFGAVSRVGSIVLTWTRVAGARGYVLFRSEKIHTFNFAKPFVSLGSTASSYTDRAVRAGGRYYYIVRAVGLTGQSTNSPEISAAQPAVPTPTATPRPTAKPTPIPTAIPTPTSEPEPTIAPEPTATPVVFLPTSTPEPEPTATATPGPTSEPEPTATAVPDPTNTSVPEPTATSEPEPAATAVPEPTETALPAPTATAVPDPTATTVPTNTPIPTATPIPMPATGVYRITTRGQSAMALDVSGFSTSNGAKVQLWDAGATCNQQWLVEKTTDGSYALHAYSGSFCNQMLDLTGGSTTTSTSVKLYQDNGNSAQRWIFKPVGNGFYRIIPQNAGASSAQTLDLSGGDGATRGSVTAIYPYYGGANQEFRFDNPGFLQPTPGVYGISPKIHPELAFDIEGFGNGNGSFVSLFTNNHTSNQQWMLETTGANVYKVSAYSGRNSLQVLDLANGKTADGNPVTTYEDNGNTAQKWFFKQTDGFYRIIPQNAGWDSLRTLDVMGGTNAKLGSRLNIFGYLGTSNQLFILQAPGAAQTLPSPKKGLGGRPELAGALGLSWQYNWGGAREAALPASVEFVPMVWGYYGGDATGYANDLKNIPGTKSILAFNEPDQKGQADISVDRALEGYQYLAKAGIPIGSPACANPMSQWMQDFMNGAKARNYRVDYVAVHCYIRDPYGFLNQIEQIHNRYWDKQIWITEFGPTSWTDPDQVTDAEAANFMKIVLPELNKRWYVDRYAWYAGADHGPWTLGPAALRESDGSLTALGKLYARY